MGGLTLVGEPGIGKSALCEQLATIVLSRGGRALVDARRAVRGWHKKSAGNETNPQL